MSSETKLAPLPKFLSCLFDKNDNIVGVAKLPNDKGFKYGYFTLDKRGKVLGMLREANENKAEVGVVLSSIESQYVGMRKAPPGEKGPRHEIRYEHCRVIFLDVDFGDTNTSDVTGYQDVKSAIDALDQIVSDGVVPKYSCIVGSGGGLHVYWRLKSALPIDTWKIVAQNFVETIEAADPKLATDPAASRHATSYPKLPTFKNIKRGKKVELIYCRSNPIDHKKYNKATVRSKQQQKADKITNSKTTGVIDIEALVRSCGMIKFAYNNPDLISEPVWFDLALALAHTKDGRKYFHKVSSAYTNYSSDETDKKFDTAEDYAKQGKGKVRCKTIHKHLTAKSQSSPCRSCHLARLNGTPIDHALTYRAKQHSINDPILAYLPPSYFVAADGTLANQTNITTASGETKSVITTVCTFPIVCTGVHTLEATDESLAIFKCRDAYSGQWIEVQLELSYIPDVKKLVQHFASRGFMIYSQLYLGFQKFCIDAVGHHTANNARSVMFQQLGWKNGHFNMGNKMITGTEIKPIEMVTDEIRKETSALDPVGNMADWRKAFDLFNRKGLEPYAVVVLSAFAAPLMKLVPNGTNGVMVNLVSFQSGRGKSLALKFMQSVLGRPDLKGFSAGMGDTIKFRHRFLSIMCNLPIVWDEVTSIDSLSLSSFLYTLSQGNLRRVLDKSSRVRSFDLERPWHTVVVSSSNRSLANKLRDRDDVTNAETARLIEFNVDHTPVVSMEDANKAMASIDNNYGHAFIPFIQYVCANKDSIIKRLSVVKEAMLANTSLDSTSRFTIDFMTAWQVGAEIAKQLNLHDYNYVSIASWMLGKTVEQAHEEDGGLSSEKSTYSAAEDYLTRYIKDSALNTMVTMRTISTTETLEESWIGGVPLTEFRQQGAIRVHTVVTKTHNKDDDTKTYIDTADFRQWLKKQGYNSRDVLRMIKNQHIATESRYYLGRCRGSVGMIAYSHVLSLNYFNAKVAATFGGFSSSASSNDTGPSNVVELKTYGKQTE